MRYRARGFTLIELMVTLAVTAIVLSIAIPSFQSQLLNNRSIALGEDFATAINLARSEAVKRSTRVSICASKFGTACDGEWVDGFIIFVDLAARDADSDPDVGAILKVWGKQDPNAVITAKSGAVDVSFIRYTSLGTMARVTDNSIVIEAQLKKCTGSAARNITVGLSGMVSVVRAACNAS